MKIRTDFVTNSSSSCFVAYGIYDEKLAAMVEELLQYHNEYPNNGVGYISVDNNVISITRELFDVDDYGDYNLFMMDPEDEDGRTRSQIAADNRQALKVDNVINAFRGFFCSEFLTDEVEELIETAVKEGGAKARTYFDATDGFCDEDFSCDADKLRKKREEYRSSKKSSKSKDDAER